MAKYKVPQDVEADDKLIGPFSPRQCIYLLIVVLSIVAAWGLSKLFFPLLIIPLPIIVFFGALALPLRKDQPMEIYMAAMVSFFLKPHKRLWQADGIESLIEVTVPRIIEVQRVKDITRSEAEQRLGYLAELVDSQGWAVRGVGLQAPNSAMTSDAYFAAQQTEDILDSGTNISQNLDHRLEESDAKRMKDVVSRMQTQAATPAAASTIDPVVNNPFTITPATLPSSQPQQTAPQTTDDPATPVFNPYPNIQQSVIQPLGSVPPTSVAAPVVNTSEKPVSPDIMNLANNTDLSIETIAHEANRIHEKEDLSEEVVISLR